jgi:EmrB/QacA subfamily drug resistance transporter
MNSSRTDTREYKRRWWTLVVIALSVLIVIIDSSIVNVALPTLQRELDATGSELQWIINAYILAFAAMMLTMGTLGDRLGRARMLQAGIVLFAGASLAAAFSNSAVQLIIWRTIMGIGGAMILPATLAIITNVFPVEERGKAIGVWAGLNGIGVALGPIVGGLLIESWDWSSIFLINLPIAAVALVAGWFLVPDSKNPNPKRLDIPGTTLSAVSLSGLIFGLIKGGDWGWTDPAIIGSLAGSAALMAIFILWERYTDHSMLEIGFFRNPRFSAGVGAVSLVALSQIGITFGLTLYMQFVQGYSALDTGIRFVPLAVGIIAGAGSSHVMVVRLGTTRVITVGFIGTTVLVGLASMWQINTAFWQLGAIFFGWGFFLGYIAAPAADAIMGGLPEARAGIGSAMNSVSRMVAGAIGIATLGTALNNIYSSSFSKAISEFPGLPPEVVGAASDSVGVAITIAEKLPVEAGTIIAQTARESFMDGWQIMAFISCAISVLAAIFVIRFMPPKHEAVSKTNQPDNVEKQ